VYQNVLAPHALEIRTKLIEIVYGHSAQ
jgi:hypothetical protein